MQRALVSAIVAVPAVALCAALRSPPTPCPNLFEHEPVLLYETTGYTLCCWVDFELTLYGDGFARVSSAAFEDGRARVASVTRSTVQSLLSDLGALGAGKACDAPDFVTESPLSTLTLLRGSTDGRAHTWSWMGDDGHGNQIQSRLARFVRDAFPGF